MTSTTSKLHVAGAVLKGDLCPILHCKVHSHDYHRRDCRLAFESCLFCWWGEERKQERYSVVGAAALQKAFQTSAETFAGSVDFLRAAEAFRRAHAGGSLPCGNLQFP